METTSSVDVGGQRGPQGKDGSFDFIMKFAEHKLHYF